MFRQKRKFHYQHQKFTIAFDGCVPIQELWFGITDKESDKMRKTLCTAILASLISLPAAASSDDAWQEFTADVQVKCLAATEGMIENAKIVVDPFGSESYGLAIVSGKAKGADATISHICVYDKQAKTVEIGGEMTTDTVKIDIPDQAKP
jgi:hypothetical protein